MMTVQACGLCLYSSPKDEYGVNGGNGTLELFYNHWLCSSSGTCLKILIYIDITRPVMIISKLGYLFIRKHEMDL